MPHDRKSRSRLSHAGPGPWSIPSEPVMTTDETKTTGDVVCPQCGGLNDPDSRYCWHCGASLRGWFRRPRRNRDVGWGARALKWVLAVAVVLGVLYGIYYAVDRFLLPLFTDEEVQAEVVTTTTSSTVMATSTTTTTVPRKDTLLVGGKDRYGTALVVSEYGFPSGASTVVLAAGDDYAGAISAAPLAAVYGGPLLLLPPEGVRTDIGAEIERLSPSQVFLVGVSRVSTVRRQLDDVLDDVEVKSLVGDDIYETATLVAEEIEVRLGSVSKVVVVPSDSFVEALTVVPLAGAKGWPILLAPTDAVLRSGTRGVIEELGVSAALVVGTSAEVSVSEVDRLVGTDAFDTAALVVRHAVQQGLSFAHTAIATGESFPDGLVVGARLATESGILLLTKDGELPGPLLSLFDANLEDIRKLEFIALPGLKKELLGSSGGTG